MARNKKKEAEAPRFRRAVERAVEILGGVRSLARATEPTLTHTTIRNFLRMTDRPPRPAHAIAVENATESRVDRMEFYPEIMEGALGNRIVAFLNKYRARDNEAKAIVAELLARGIL